MLNVLMHRLGLPPISPIFWGIGRCASYIVVVGSSQWNVYMYFFDILKEKKSLMAFPWIGTAVCIHLWQRGVIVSLRDYIKKGTHRLESRQTVVPVRPQAGWPLYFFYQ
jgi:hypothetical protein